MLKEKVNTHFSFPLQLNMSGYMEKNLLPPATVFSASNSPSEGNDVASNGEASPPQASVNSDAEQNLQEEAAEDESAIYELIGVTVHTGTAEGGHYYSFIRERSSDQAAKADESSAKAKWYVNGSMSITQLYIGSTRINDKKNNWS